MMRPTYENDRTLALEGSIAAVIEKCFKVVLHKMPRSYSFDFLVMRNDKAVGWAEVKDRPLFHFPTYMISVHKVVAAKTLTLATGLPATLFVRLQGDLRYYTFGSAEESMWQIGIGGRQDRNDPADVEACLFIPIDKFKPVKL